jgi:hypothetical protein
LLAAAELGSLLLAKPFGKINLLGVSLNVSFLYITFVVAVWTGTFGGKSCNDNRPLLSCCSPHQIQVVCFMVSWPQNALPAFAAMQNLENMIRRIFASERTFLGIVY